MLSLRYKQLQRGIEDFYLVKEAVKKNPIVTQQLLDAFLGSSEPKEWMKDSHTSNQRLFNQQADEYEAFRKQLIASLS